MKKITLLTMIHCWCFVGFGQHPIALNALMNEFWSCTDNFKCF